MDRKIHKRFADNRKIRNKEIDEAKTLLSEHKNVLVESGLYDDATRTIEKMQKTILKASN